MARPGHAWLLNWIVLLVLCVVPLITLTELCSAPTTEPVVRIVYPNGGETVNGTILIQWEVLNPPEATPRFKLEFLYWEHPEWVPIVSGITSTSYPWDTRNLDHNGRYVIKVTLTSTLPHVSDESDDFFIIDNGDLPKVRVIYPNGGEIIGGEVLITWSARNPSQYLVTYEVFFWSGQWMFLVGNYSGVSYHWDTTQVNDGQSQIQVICYSPEGVTEDTSDFAFTIHNGAETAHAPAIRVISPNGGETLTGDVEITWTATDPDDDPLTYSLRCWDGVQWQSLTQNVKSTNWTWNTLYHDEGTNYLVEVMVSDGEYFATDQSDTIFTVHHLPPVVDILWPQTINDTPTILTEMAWINWTVSNPGNYKLVYGIDLWINNQWLHLARNLTTTTFEWDTRVFPNGKTYQLRVLANYGPLSNEGLTTTTFHIENDYWQQPQAGTAPEVEIQTPNGGESWKGQQQIRWVAADPDGNRLTYDVLFWNGTCWVTLVRDLHNTSLTWDTSRLSSRTDYRVLVTAFDGVDRGLDISNDAFSIGGNPPLVEFLYPHGGETLQGNVTIAWSGFDPDQRGLLYTLEYYHENDWTILFSNITETIFIWNTRLVANGQDYKLRVIANNGYLTGQAAHTEHLTVSNSFPPTVTVVWPNGGEDLHGTVELRWNASDPNDPPSSLSYIISYCFEEDKWVILAEDLHSTSFLWNTSEVPDVNWVVIRIHVTDPANLTAIDDSDAGFKIMNAPSTRSNLPTSVPSRISPKLYWGFVIIGLVLITYVSFGLGVARRQQRVAAYENAFKDKTQIEKDLREIDVQLKQVKKQEKALRAEHSGWPSNLKKIKARLNDLEFNPFVADFINTKQEVLAHQKDVLGYIATMAAQVQRILPYLNEKRQFDETIEEIGADDDLRVFANAPEEFVRTHQLKSIPPLARRVQHLIKQAGLTRDEHKIAPELFSIPEVGTELKIKGFLKHSTAYLDAQRQLNKEKANPQVVSYLKGRRFFKELHKLETIKKDLHTTRNTLETKLNKLKHLLESEEKKQITTKEEKVN